jgi:competence protein ComEC
VSVLPRLRASHVLAGALSVGLALSLVTRVGGDSAAGVAVALVMTAFVSRDERSRLLALVVAVTLAGAWWGSARLDRLDASALAPRVGEAGLAQAEVTGPARFGRFALRVPVRVRSFDGREVDEAARLELPLGRAPPQGALIRVVATVMRPDGPDDSGGFDEREYLRRQGVHVVLRAGWYEQVGRRGGVAGVTDRLRGWLAGGMAPGLHGERRAIVAGVVLGNDQGLDDSLRQAFRASGLYHLLAVSGQNIVFVVLAVLLAAWVSGVPRWTAHVCAIAAVAAYTAAVGWQPSVIRAGIAGGLASLAWLASRPADRWYFLLVGAAVLLAVNPYTVLEAGFQLSFAAVAAIFVLVPRFERRLEGYPLPRKLAEGLAISAACGLATAPVLWLQFGSVPVYSVAANALAAPVVGPLLVLGLACAALNPFVPSAAAALAWVNGWLAAYLAWCARFVGSWPHAQVSSLRLLAGIAVACGLVVAAARIRPPRLPRIALLAGLIATAVGGSRIVLPDAGHAPPPPTGLRVTFLDVGQGDATLLQVPEGAILVDEGPPEADVAGQLARLGVHRLDAIVLTHPQRDHVGGAASVIDRLRVGFVLDPGIPAKSPDEDAAHAAAERRDVRIVLARAGEGFRLGRLRIRVLWPDGPGLASQDPNDHAIVLLASYGATDVLLTADAESNVTLPLRPPAVEIVKVAHHGSVDDGLTELLDDLRPRIAVIEVGRHNDYGHPAPSTLAALAAAPGLAVYRTDRDGRVVVESDGERITVREKR